VVGHVKPHFDYSDWNYTHVMNFYLLQEASCNMIEELDKQAS